MKLLIAESLDPYFNLATEAHLVEDHEPREPMLVLWRCENTVVIGKNQNPWREVDLGSLKESGGKLARRISGGGAVFHDAGNLNYAIVLDRNRYKSTVVYEAVTAALMCFGVKAEVRCKSSLFVGDRKISGNAFCYKKQSVLHHGTLLVEADLSRLNRVLKPKALPLETRAIASVPSKVVNLSELAEAITLPNLESALVQSFAAIFGAVSGEPEIDISKRDAGAIKLASRDWLFGHTPKFTVRMNGEDVAVVKGLVDTTGEPFDPTQLEQEQL